MLFKKLLASKEVVKATINNIVNTVIDTADEINNATSTKEARIEKTAAVLTIAGKRLAELNAITLPAAEAVSEYKLAFKYDADVIEFNKELAAAETKLSNLKHMHQYHQGAIDNFFAHFGTEVELPADIGKHAIKAADYREEIEKLERDIEFIKGRINAATVTRNMAAKLAERFETNLNEVIGLNKTDSE